MWALAGMSDGRQKTCANKDIVPPFISTTIRVSEQGTSKIADKKMIFQEY